MNSQRQSRGHALAALGGAGLAASLWLPWYTVQFSQAAVNSIAQSAQQLGALAPLVRSGAQLLNQLGPFHVTAWQAFKTMPAVLLVVAVIAGGLALLALTDRARITSQPTMLAGAVGAVLVGYRIVVPPGQGSFVHPAWGIYLALISALLMLAGGALSGSEGREPIPTATQLDPTAYTPEGASTGWPPAPAATPYTTSQGQSTVTTVPAATWSADQSVPPPVL